MELNNYSYPDGNGNSDKKEKRKQSDDDPEKMKASYGQLGTKLLSIAKNAKKMYPVPACELDVTSHQAYIVEESEPNHFSLKKKYLREFCPPNTVKRLGGLEWSPIAGIAGIHDLKNLKIKNHISTSQNILESLSFNKLLKLQEEAISGDDLINRINDIQKEMLTYYVKVILPFLYNMLYDALEGIDPLLRELYEGVTKPSEQQMQIEYTPDDLSGSLYLKFMMYITEIVDVLNVVFSLLKLENLQNFAYIYTITSTDPDAKQEIFDKMFSNDKLTQRRDWNVVPKSFFIQSSTLSVSQPVSEFTTNVGLLPTFKDTSAPQKGLNIIKLPNFGGSKARGITLFDILTKSLMNYSYVFIISTACTHLMLKNGSDYPKYIVDANIVSSIQEQINSVYGDSRIIMRLADAEEILSYIKNFIKEHDEYLYLFYRAITLFEKYIDMKTTVLPENIQKEWDKFFIHSNALLHDIRDMKLIINQLATEKGIILIPYSLETIDENAGGSRLKRSRKRKYGSKKRIKNRNKKTKKRGQRRTKKRGRK
jgi:hypothetical protein